MDRTGACPTTLKSPRSRRRRAADLALLTEAARHVRVLAGALAELHEGAELLTGSGALATRPARRAPSFGSSLRARQMQGRVAGAEVLRYGARVRPPRSWVNGTCAQASRVRPRNRWLRKAHQPFPAHGRSSETALETASARRGVTRCPGGSEGRAATGSSSSAFRGRRTKDA